MLLHLCPPDFMGLTLVRILPSLNLVFYISLSQLFFKKILHGNIKRTEINAKGKKGRKSSVWNTN